MGNMGGDFPYENTPEGCTETYKSSFLFHINQQVGEMVIMNDLEWPMLSYYVIYYEKFKKVMQRTEKETSKQGGSIDYLHA